MELEELKCLWNESNLKLEASIRLNTLLVAQRNVGRADTFPKRLARGIGFELIVNLVGIFLLGWFAADHSRELKFFIPAVLLGVYAIALVISGARHLFELRRLRYDEPVVAIQDRLQRLRLARIRATMGALLLAPLMWLPLLVVASRGFFGADIYAAASPVWLAANVLFGLAVIPVAVVIARALRRRLVCALDDLAAIRRFAEEG